jgi:hypothetical protein
MHRIAHGSQERDLARGLNRTLESFVLAGMTVPTKPLNTFNIPHYNTNAFDDTTVQLYYNRIAFPTNQASNASAQSEFRDARRISCELYRVGQ